MQKHIDKININTIRRKRKSMKKEREEYKS